MSKKLRVGFDLDGVLLYNPARIIRAPVVRLKHKFIPKREKLFYIPQSEFEKTVWEFLHVSSLFIAPGLQTIKKLKQEGKIEPYIVTARFGFMKPGFLKWLNKMNAQDIFEGAFINENNLQPPVYKKRLADRLKLDFFIEDNFDIVTHLSKNSKVKTYWIYNIFDKQLDYPYKFPSLKEAVKHLKENELS